MTTTGVTMTSAALVVFYGTLCYAWGCMVGFSIGRRQGGSNGRNVEEAEEL